MTLPAKSRGAKLSPISLLSLRLVQYRNGHQIGSGTGFLYDVEGQTFLVTNYHVLTARLPKEPSRTMPDYPDSPDRIEWIMFDEDSYPRTGGVDLIGENDPVHWVEHRDRDKGVDLVALPVNVPANSRSFKLNQLDLVDDIGIEVASDLFVVGYPFGVGAGDLFPIWKRGTIASDPCFKPEGLKRFYIDSSGKPGMSGSPVFATELRLVADVTRQGYEAIEAFGCGQLSAMDAIKAIGPEALGNPYQKRVFQFIGVYSGSLASREKDPNIGIVWSQELIKEMFANPVIADHPYPPNVVA